MIQESYNSPFVTKADLDSLRKTTEDCFMVVDEKQHNTDKKIDQLTEIMINNFDKVYGKFGEIDKRFEKVDRRFDKINEKFEKNDKKFDKIDERFEKVDSDLGLIKNKLLRIDSMENSLDLIKKHLGIKDAGQSSQGRE